MRRVVNGAIKYITNHIITHIPSYTVRHAWYRGVLGWYVDPDASVLMDQYIQMTGVRTSGKRVSIGAGTVINRGCMLYTTGGLLIGENVSIGAGVWLVTGSHDMNDPGFPDTYKPIVIDDYAWIGMRSTILGGVTIGRGAVVMAGAVVSRDVGPCEVVGGVPARVVRERDPEALTYALRFRPIFE